MLIRKATESDKQNLIAELVEFDNYLSPLFSEAIRPFAFYKNKIDLFNKVISDWITNPKYILLIAEENGELVGHICGSINISNVRIKDKEGMVEEWFVSEKYRSVGVGKVLYETLSAEFKKANCTHVSLKVFKDNKKAIDLYKKMGFKEFELIMIKSLS